MHSDDSKTDLSPSPPSPRTVFDARERWSRVSALLDAALELPTADRAAFVGAIHDADLREEVARLLAACARAEEGGVRLVTGGAASMLSPPDADTAMNDDTGSLLRRVKAAVAGRYDVEREIGRGGMAIVFLARDLRHARRVALKVVRPDLAAAVMMERFLQEIRIAAQLSHPHILPLLDSGEAEGLLYYAMPFVEGESLKQRLARDGRLPVKEALRIAREVADALDHAHRHDVVHRDVKPDNILLNEGQAVIADFGIARAMGEATADPLTLTGSIIGTAEYMSPEQAAGERELDGRSDVFSLGCVLYEMLTGSTPFRGATAQARTAARLTRAAPSVREARPELSETLAGIVANALMTAPGERYGTAGEMSGAIEALGERTSTLTSADSPDRPDRRRLVALAGATALVALGVLVAWILAPEPRPLVVVSTTRLTHAPELESDVALSPDGQFVAYVGTDESGSTIFVRQIRGDRIVRLTDSATHRARWPRWSTDGTRIAFHANDGIYVIPALGGQRRRVVTVPPVDALMDVPPLGVAWSPDDTELAYAWGKEIRAVKLRDGTTRKVTEAFEPSLLDWSPDGTWLAFASGNTGYSRGDNIAPSAIGIVPTRGGMPTLLTDVVTLNTNPVWLPGARSLLFVSNRGGGRDVFRLRLRADGTRTGEAERVTTAARVHTISVSATGALKLAYTTRRKIVNIASVAVDESRTRSVAEAQSVTWGDQQVDGIGISDDGRTLVYDSDLAGNQDIYVMPAQGGDAVRLTDDPADDFVPSWSSSAGLIAFYSTRTGSRDIFTMSFDGTDQRQVTTSPGRELYPDWSPDGTRLVFMSDGGLQVVERQRGGSFGSPRRLVQGESKSPRWSPDGRWIAYVGADASVRLVTPDGVSVQTLWSPAPRRGTDVWGPRTGHVEWSGDGRTIYYMNAPFERQWSIWAISVADASARSVLAGDDRSRPTTDVFAVHDRRIYFGSGKFEGDIWLVELRDR
jgi:serine/threonine protein kinase/Tol biopolymer transport system component